MPHTRTRTILLLAALVLAAAPAHAGSGPCGIQTGTWTATKATCNRIKAGGHNITGRDSHVSFGRGGKWAQWEMLCDIRRPTRHGKICTMEVHCHVEGTPFIERTSFKIINPTTIAFGDTHNAYTDRHTLCTTKPFSRYFDLD